MFQIRQKNVATLGENCFLFWINLFHHDKSKKSQSAEGMTTLGIALRRRPLNDKNHFLILEEKYFGPMRNYSRTMKNKEFAIYLLTDFFGTKSIRFLQV